MARLPVETRRRALLEASLRVIEREGITETTTRKIAAEARMPLASLHYAFASRQELIAETMKMLSREVAGAFAEAGRREVAPGPGEAAANCLHRFVDYLTDNPGKTLAMLEVQAIGTRSKDLGYIAESAVNRGVLIYEYILRHAAAHFGLSFDVPYASLGSFVMSALDGALLHWFATRDDEQLKRSVDTTVSALLAMGRQLPEEEAAQQREQLLAGLHRTTLQDIIDGKNPDFDRLV